MKTVDPTVRDYTREWDSVRIREAQKLAYSRAMDDLLRRHDSGEVLTEAEYRALTIHWVGPEA